jgi:ribosomal protein L3 glutamine methyltransferase
MDIREAIEIISAKFDASEIFYGHGTDNSIDEAVYLVCTLLNVSYDQLSVEQSQKIDDDDYSMINLMVNRRITERKPLAYLLGAAWFGGYQFKCDERALVPRSPIAELVINGFEPFLEDSPKRILDLCSGGGCLGITTALTFPDSRVDLADIDLSALALADENIQLHGIQDRVTTIESDLFQHLEGTYDVIIANPPYVSQSEYDGLPAEYLQEPKLGLVCDQAGLEFSLHILQSSAAYLKDGGLLVLEVGYSKGDLERRLPHIPLLWLEFKHGGDGVLAISKQELTQFGPGFL